MLVLNICFFFSFRAMLFLCLVHFVGNQSTELPCGPHNYRDQSTGTCKLCMILHKSVYYDIISECTPTSNAVIRCVEGYYHDREDPHPPCKVCKNCYDLGLYEAAPCSDNHNAECCPEKGKNCQTEPTRVTTPKSIPRVNCTEKDFKGEDFCTRWRDGCLEDEYYICHADNGGTVCRSCQNGTSLNESLHFSSECTPRIVGPENSDEIQKCDGERDAQCCPSDKDCLETYIIVIIVLLVALLFGASGTFFGMFIERKFLNRGQYNTGEPLLPAEDINLNVVETAQ